MENSKVLIIGLGSMGKRRIRCLNSIGDFNIYGFDSNKKRQNQVFEEFGINILKSIKSVKKESFDFFIISTSPESHHIYIELALKLRIPSFIEASVLDTNYSYLIDKSNQIKVPIVPSCTMIFHPAIKYIKNIIDKNKYGRFLSMSYSSGQYLEDWHSYENVSDFYVSKKETGGAREIVPFELTWITHIFGFPKNITAVVKKTTDIPGAEKIDDTYNLIMEYNTAIINLNVDVIARKATRNLIINFEYGQINWDWNHDKVLVYDPKAKKQNTYSYKVKSQSGYLKNISESMYVEELNSFINHIKFNKQYPSNFMNDYKILKLLYTAEKSSKYGKKYSV